MKGKGLIAGTLVGMGAGMLAASNMSNATKRRIKKSTKKMMNSAENILEDMWNK